MRKTEILNTAEAFFCRKGYSTTRINDILNTLNISKGSFYHHFVSKQSVLEKLCECRAEKQYQKMLSVLNNEQDPLKRLDIVFYGIIPFGYNDQSFFMMILPIIDQPEGRNVLECWTEKLLSVFVPTAENEVLSLREKGIIYPFYEQGVTEICICLINKMWSDTAKEIANTVRYGKETDIARYLNAIELYRHVIERILEAQWGSVHLTDISEIETVIEQLLCRKRQ